MHQSEVRVYKSSKQFYLLDDPRSGYKVKWKACSKQKNRNRLSAEISPGLAGQRCADARSKTHLGPGAQH